VRRVWDQSAQGLGSIRNNDSRLVVSLSQRPVFLVRLTGDVHGRVDVVDLGHSSVQKVVSVRIEIVL